MPELTDIQRDLLALAADLKRLEAEYTMFFAGRAASGRRGRRAAASRRLVKRWGRGHITGTSDRFRFEMLQSRFQSLIDLWDRALRAKEEGRPGPFAQPPAKPAAPAAPRRDSQGRARDGVQGSRARDRQAARALRLVDGCAAHAGDEVVPFHKFAALVSSQVSKLRQHGSAEVAFRVAVKEGKVNFTVRGMKGAKD